MQIPRLHKETALFSATKRVSATLDVLADSITSLVKGEETYTGPDGETHTSAVGTAIKQLTDNVLIKATRTAGSAAAVGQSIIQSFINVAPEGIKIAAAKVDIEGAAIFKTGGKLGKVVKSSETQWYSSTSSTKREGGSWSTNQPAVTAGRYIWQRTHYYYTDDTDNYSPSESGVCITAPTDVPNSARRSVQLWFTKANNTPPSKPTSRITSTSTSGGDWRVVVPAYNASYPYYFYCWQYELTDGTYDWSDVVLDSSATESQGRARSAQARSQLVYVSKKANTGSVASNTTWVTQSADVQNTWTTTRPTYSSEYPILFVATQSQSVAQMAAGNTCSCTTPVKDTTTTVIDGGHLITGTVDATALKANTLKVTNFTQDDQQVISDRVTNAVFDASVAALRALYGTCATGAGTSSKSVSCSDFQLVTGASVRVRFNNANTVQGKLTLNVNGTGAKPVYVNGTEVSGTNLLLWATNAVIAFTYDGNYWQVVHEPRTWQGRCSVAAATAAKTDASSRAVGAVVCKGAVVNMTMAYANTAANPTLQLGGMPALPIHAEEANVAADSPLNWTAGAVVAFTFNGTCFDYDGNSGRRYAQALAVANGAMSRTQTIFRQAASGTNTMAQQTTWVTATDESVNAAGTATHWTAKRPTYSKDFPVIFVAIQSQTIQQYANGNTCSCTTPLKDDTMTVIDGGHITTGEIDASVVTVKNIDASKITTGELDAARIKAGSLAIGKFTNEVQSKINKAGSDTTYRGVCSSPPTALIKVVDCAGFSLVVGATVVVYMERAQTYTDGPIQLNVESTGAQIIYAGSDQTSSTNQLLWAAGATITFMFDGRYWVVADSPGVWNGGVCDVSSWTDAKTASCEKVVLFDGASVKVQMGIHNTGTSPTLNVQSLGARPIYFGMTSTSPTLNNGYSWTNNSIVEFVFDGQCWRTGTRTYINGGDIVTGAITATKIAANAITAEKIASGAIDADKIAANAITASKIASGAISADKIAAGAITAEKLSAGSISGDKISGGTIKGANYYVESSNGITEITPNLITLKPVTDEGYGHVEIQTTHYANAKPGFRISAMPLVDRHRSWSIEADVLGINIVSWLKSSASLSLNSYENSGHIQLMANKSYGDPHPGYIIEVDASDGIKLIRVTSSGSWQTLESWS